VCGGTRPPACRARGTAASAGSAHGRGRGGRARLAPAESGGANRGPTHARFTRVAGDIERGLRAVHDAQAALRPHVAEGWALQATLAPDRGRAAARQAQLPASDDPTRQHLGHVMARFAPGRFVGGADADLPQDTLDLERWFRQPKGHERRIHGHRHAGVRLVPEGPTLLRALDAHIAHPQPFTAAE